MISNATSLLPWIAGYQNGLNNDSMNILITGVHGFVGSNLVKYLSKENTIYGLDIVQPEKEGVKCTFSWDALDNPNSMPEIDAM